MKSVFGNMGTENKTERFEHEVSVKYYYDRSSDLSRQIFNWLPIN